MRTIPKTRICPNCCCELPEEDFLEPEDFEALEAAIEDELELMSRGPLREPTAVTDLLGEPGEEDLERLLELVVDALLACGLGETFFEWQGEVALDRRRPGNEVVLSGTSAPAPRRRRGKNGRLVIAASLRPAGGGRGDDSADGSDG